MYVIYHSSDAFAEVTGVSIISLFENNKNMDSIHVLCIEHGISDENKQKLKQLADKYCREIEFMQMPNWSEKLHIDLKSCKSGWLGFGYNRLFLTEYIPPDIDRVLYLDSDTIIEASLDELWNIDFNDCYMAGVDDCLSSKYRDIVDIGIDGIYCNAGVLLFNLKKWREDDITAKFIKIIYENNGYFVFNEQSILNSLFSGTIKILPLKYNVNSLVYLFSFEELLKLRQPFNFSYSKEEYIAAGKNPIITHYTGNFYVERRPWIENSDHPHKDAYIKYRNMSPWKESAMVSDKRSYKKRVMSKVCKSLPRFLMLSFVSFLYNNIRPIYFESKLKEMRHK